MLYRADGFAVKELLKIASLLYDAIQIDKLDEVSWFALLFQKCFAGQGWRGAGAVNKA
jgi:hypothetical protein